MTPRTSPTEPSLPQGHDRPKPRRILVLDDESLLAFVAQRTLDREVLTLEDGTTVQRFETHAFSSPADAVSCVDFLDFDLYLLDIRLGAPMSGYDVADAILARRPSAKIIFMSGSDEEIGRARGRFLAKPWAPEALVRMVDEALANGHDAG